MIVTIKVVPQSGRSGCVLDKAGSIKCFLKSPPEKGKANAELVAFLAQKLGVTKLSITIVGGLASRKKVVRIDAPLTEQQLFDRLSLQRPDAQTTIFDATGS